MGQIEYAGHEGFWNTRFRLMEQSLSPANQMKFANMPLAKKKLVVARMVDKGLMI